MPPGVETNDVSSYVPGMGEIADDLRQAIENSGLGLRELARAINEPLRNDIIDHGQLSRFMRDERRLRMDVFEAVCKHFGLRLVKSRRR